MSGEKPFNPEDENARAMNYNDFLNQLTPEQRAKVAATTEAAEAGRPLREARENVEWKKRQAALAVEEREKRQHEEQKNNNDFFCQELAAALDQNNSAVLDLYIDNFLEEQTDFKQLANLKDIQKLFDRVATSDERVIMGTLPEQKILDKTVSKKVPMADGTVKSVNIKVNADFSSGKDRPVVWFTVSEIPSEPKQNLEASAPLKPVKNKVAPPNPSKTLIQKMTRGLRGLFGSKK